MDEVVTLRCKVKLKKTGDDRIRAQFFLGKSLGDLQLSGELILTIGEYQNIICGLSIGLSKMIRVADGVRYIPMRVHIEGEKTAFGRADELNGEKDETFFPEKL